MRACDCMCCMNIIMAGAGGVALRLGAFAGLTELVVMQCRKGWRHQMKTESTSSVLTVHKSTCA